MWKLVLILEKNCILLLIMLALNIDFDQQRANRISRLMDYSVTGNLLLSN